jgi:hypothetical protein
MDIPILIDIFIESHLSMRQPEWGQCTNKEKSQKKSTNFE